MKVDYRLSVGMSEDVANVVKALADETRLTESAVARFLILNGLSSIGRMPQRPNGERQVA